MNHQGEAICCDCDRALDWVPSVIMPGSYYVCGACEQKGLESGSLIHVEEFFGEWDLFTEDGQKVNVA